MPPSRRRTPRSQIEQLRAELVQDLAAADQAAREFVEAYVVADNIERLEDDRIVPRFARLLVYFSSEVEQIWGDGRARRMAAAHRRLANEGGDELVEQLGIPPPRLAKA